MICSNRRRTFPSPNRRKLRALLETAINRCGLRLGAKEAVSITTVGPLKIAEINRHYVGHQGATDVICFDYRSPEVECAGCDVAIDVIICPDVAAERGEEIPGTSYSREMALYLAHALLHACGFDDQEARSRTKMKRREKEVMAQLSRSFDFREIFPPQN